MVGALIHENIVQEILFNTEDRTVNMGMTRNQLESVLTKQNEVKVHSTRMGKYSVLFYGPPNTCVRRIFKKKNSVLLGTLESTPDASVEVLGTGFFLPVEGKKKNQYGIETLEDTIGKVFFDIHHKRIECVQIYSNE